MSKRGQFNWIWMVAILLFVVIMIIIMSGLASKFLS